MPTKKTTTPKKTVAKKATAKKPTVKKTAKTKTTSNKNVNNLIDSGKTYFDCAKRRVRLDKIDDYQLMNLIDNCIKAGIGYNIV